MQVRFLIIWFLLTAQVNAQTFRTDSIKAILPALSGAAEVNSLNALGREYYFYWVHSDSALKYADLAYRKASAMHYSSGQAEALLTRAGVEGRLLGHPPEMEQHARDAITILKAGNDAKTMSMATYYLGIALCLQGRYHQAEEPLYQAKQLALATKDRFSLGWAEQGIGFLFYKSGQYWKSFDHLVEAQQIGKEVKDSVLTALSLSIIARSFNLAGDPQTALNYYHWAFAYGMPFIRLWSHQEDMAYAHFRLNQLDSAEYYQRLNTRDLETMTTDQKVRKKFTAFSFGYSVIIQLAKKQYDSVLQRVLPVVDKLRQSRDVVPYMQSLYVLGRVYEGKGRYQTALHYLRELHQAAEVFTNRHMLKDANELLASVFAHANQNDSAYYYYQKYTILKDSMETAQYAGRTALYLAASEARNKIRLLSKDNEINEQQLRLNKKELQKEAQLKNMLAGGLALLLLISFLVFRNIILNRKNEKLKNEHEQSALKRKALELEMQALRAQMNPHFIFNCLSAIDNLIQTNQPDKATTCLSRFAKLIRGVLDSSKNNLVPFQKDFETLKLYLEMEQFRCNNKFSYQLHADPELLYSDYKVPPLIIQPFIENAIHHGLLNKQDGNRQLNVKAALQSEQIIYSVTDNGVGRVKAGILKEMNRPGHRSYGIEISKERIHLHNRTDLGDDLLITDLQEQGLPSGTEAVIRLNSFQ